MNHPDAEQPHSRSPRKLRSGRIKPRLWALSVGALLLAPFSFSQTASEPTQPPQLKPDVPTPVPNPPPSDPSALPTDPSPIEDPLPIPYLSFPGAVPIPIPFRTGPIPSYQDPVTPGYVIPETTTVEDAQAVPSESFVISNFYGGAPHQITTGKGEFAGPTFRLGASLSLGYDDNVYQTPKATNGISEIDGVNGTDQTVEGDKVSSFFTTLGINASIRNAAHRRVLALDASASQNYYWSQGTSDYNFDLGLIYLHRFLAPSQLTANVRIAYLSQPDYSQVNFTQQENREQQAGNNSFLTSAKVDYSYRWSPRFSTVTSIAGNSILYEGALDDANFVSLTVGNEFRLRAERFTWIAETRYEILHYLNVEDQDSDTVFLLLGAEWKLGKWILTSARFGETIRFFETGDDSASPYGEVAVVYRPNSQNAFTFNARYGFEAGNLAETDSTVFRTGISYTRTISSRLNATISGNYVSTERSGGDLGDNQTVLDGTLSLNFRASSQLSLGASFSATRSSSDSGLQDFDQNRVALSANYQF
jgi:hypothetical protein